MGELGVRLLLNEDTLSDRLWEHKYNGRDGWQYGETTVKDEKNFRVSSLCLIKECMVVDLK